MSIFSKEKRSGRFHFESRLRSRIFQRRGTGLGIVRKTSFPEDTCPESLEGARGFQIELNSGIINPAPFQPKLRLNDSVRLNRVGKSDKMKPEAKNPMPCYRNPVPTVDIIIEIKDDKGRPGVVLIERGHPPPGWAIPGGFVEYGETLEDAAIREAREETSLEVRLVGQFHTYSAPDRDPRKHTISTVFLATAEGIPQAHDDARDARIFTPRALPSPLAFDHARILADFFGYKRRKNGYRNHHQPAIPHSRGSHGQKKTRS